MRWNIIMDSSCDLLPESSQNGGVQISSVPFIISVGKTDFVDDERLDTSVMLNAMEQCPEASHTSCPSPQGWINEFERADQSIAITISSKLSGSMNSAMLAKEMVLEQHPEKKIAVLDSRSTGPELALCVEEMKKQIDSGADFETVVSCASAFLQKTKVMFALSSFNNLVKNGRMSKIAGFVARKLGMWGIGLGSEEGTIEIKGKARGSAKAIAMLLENMRENGFSGGKVMISHCQNPAFAEKLKSKIQELWKNCDVRILPTRGLCSYYAERGGLILSY
ncbi:DegV family protein [Massilicoli timonensis]|uniref:DegV family protein n=1 Tax=Massilicoli timonensis TaxID=2015901 RepID=UPI000C837FCA|nr:DegV family protein [Massilicoli timonensis]